jgi:signal transduction histidine kinase
MGAIKIRSILFRTTILCWLLIVLTLGIFLLLVFPYQKKALIDGMISKANAISSSIAQVTTSAVVNEEYSEVIEHCMRVIEENPSIIYVVITRKDGFSLVHKAKTWKIGQMSGIWNHAATVPPAGMFIKNDLAEERVFHYSYPFSYSGINWGWINIGLSLREFNSDLRSIYVRTFFILVSCSIIGLLLSYFFARRLSYPIFLLTDITMRVAKGDLSARAELATGDELENLANSFNSMTESLQKSQKELRSTQAQLIQTGKMSAVGQLAAGVAHELNNPLSGVLINVTLLREFLSGPKFKDVGDEKEISDFLDIILESTYRCRTIIENLLSFSRQSREQHTDILDINEVIEKSLGLIATELKHGFISVKKNLQEDLPEIKGIFNKLQQVFVNLFLNAYQFMPEGGEIEITTGLCPDGKNIEARVKDTGPGIPAENMEKIFEPFFTTMAIAQGSGRGTGLGLSISYGIINEHKGQIEVESEAGKGATFIITLPINEKNEEDLHNGSDQGGSSQGIGD